MPVILASPLVALQFHGEESGRRMTIHVFDGDVEVGYVEARLLRDQLIPDCTMCAFTRRACLPAGTGCANVILLTPFEGLEYCLVSRNGRLRLCIVDRGVAADIREYMDAYGLSPFDDRIVAKGFNVGTGAEAWLAEVEGIPVVVSAVVDDDAARRKLMEEALERFASLAKLFHRSRTLTLPRV